MSMLWSGRVKVAVSLLATAMVGFIVPAPAGAKTCELYAQSFSCMSGSKAKKTLVQKTKIKNTRKLQSYRVAAVRPSARLNDATRGTGVVKPARKSTRKATRKSRKARKAGKSRRSGSARRSTRSKRSARKGRAIRTIGRRYNPRDARKVTKKSTTKRGWRTRSKGVGFAAVSGGVRTSCFPKRLRRLLNKVSAHYGRKIRITSGFRSRRHNRRIGGARRSQHIHCTAADFYIPGVNKMALARFLKRLPGRGGVGTYCGNRTVHLDVGPRRTWHWGCRKKRRYAGKRRYKRRKASVRRRAKRYTSRRSTKKRYVNVRFRGSKS